MKTLKDVYIKVTKGNVKELRMIIQPNLDVDDIVAFNSDCLNSFFYGISIGNRKKVSLTELKRLINTIPTREEIKRLKQKVSAYKMNLSLVNERCKEMQKDNDILVDCMEKLDNKLEVTERKLDIQADLIRDKNAQLAQLKQRKWWQIWK